MKLDLNLRTLWVDLKTNFREYLLAILIQAGLSGDLVSFKLYLSDEFVS